MLIFVYKIFTSVNFVNTFIMYGVLDLKNRKDII